MPQYRSTNLIPPLVKRAKNLAGQMQYKGGCSNGTGRLLRLFSSQFQSGVVGEIGGGCGVGSAWIISALAPGTSFVIVEEDPALSAVMRTLFENLPSVRVIHGEWHDIVRFGPFSMVYVNAIKANQCAPEVLLQSLRIGGMIVMDGLLPQEQMPSLMRERSDSLRSFWLNDPRLLATEILVSSSEAVILASRVE